MKKVLFPLLLLPFSLFAQGPIGYLANRDSINFTISPNEYYIEFSGANWQQTLQRISPIQTILLGNNTTKITFNLPGINFEEKKSNPVKSVTRAVA